MPSLHINTPPQLPLTQKMLNKAKNFNLHKKYSDEYMVAYVFEGDHYRTIYLSGQLARTLKVLVDCGPAGVAAREVSNWAYRLSAYIHDLRTDYGLMISTEWEVHRNARHARYVLRHQVKIKK